MKDPLIGPFAELCGALHGLQNQIKQLSRVYDAVDDFNSAFGAFQGAMALHASCLSYPKSFDFTQSVRGKEISSRTGLLKPSTVTSNEKNMDKKCDGAAFESKDGRKTDALTDDHKQVVKMKKPVAVASTKRHTKVEPHGPFNTRIKKRKIQMGKTRMQPVWTWERHIREKIPRKYQSPAELKKLENIVLYLKNRHCAISISDLVKHSGLPVIRCKEILQTLMKLDIVKRKREKSGFVYSFGPSS